MSKGAKNVKPLLLINAIVGFLTVILCVVMAVLRWLINAKIISGVSLIVNNSQFAISGLALVGFVLGIIFIAMNKNYSSSSFPSNKTLIIFNAIFWSLILIGGLCSGAIMILKPDLIPRQEICHLVWICMAVLALPVSITNLIGFVKGD